jgi:hypothetical protein
MVAVRTLLVLEVAWRRRFSLLLRCLRLMPEANPIPASPLWGRDLDGYAVKRVAGLLLHSDTGTASLDQPSDRSLADLTRTA